MKLAQRELSPMYKWSTLAASLSITLCSPLRIVAELVGPAWISASQP